MIYVNEWGNQRKKIECEYLMVGANLKNQRDSGFGNRPQRENPIVDRMNRYGLRYADSGDMMCADK